MKILMTGATGFIGKHLMKHLNNDNHQISILARNKNEAIYTFDNKVTIFSGDITKPKKLVKCCIDQDLVIHLAGHAHAGSSKVLHQEINFQGTANILDAAIVAGVSKFIYIGSSKAKKKSSPYGEAKYRAEQLVLAAHNAGKIKVCCIKPTAVYGNGMKGNLSLWISAIKKNKAPTIPPIETKIAMIGVEDLCRAILLAAKEDHVDGKSYLLSDGVPYKIKEIEIKIKNSIGHQQNSFYFPKILFYLGAIVGDLLNKILGISIGFSMNGYRTLFIDKYENSQKFAEENNFSFTQNFYDELVK